MIRVQIHVTGRVQGVGYRNFVWKKARELELAGFVKNLDDGSVTAVVEGPEPQVDLLITVMRRGPFLARVADLDTVYSPATGEFSGFEVR